MQLTTFTWRSERVAPRSGKVLVLLAILLPSLFGIVGLVIDGGLMMNEHRNLQHAADAASTAAAMNLELGKSSATAVSTANNVIQVGNELSDATVTVNIPPSSGPYAGQAGHVEVFAKKTYQSHFMPILDGIVDRSLQARSVAGVEDTPAGGAIVILDPNPANLSTDGLSGTLSAINVNNLSTALIPQTGTSAYLTPIPVIGPTAAGLVNTSLGSLLPTVITNLLSGAIAATPLTPLPTLTAGFEIEGLGHLNVDGAIYVNNEWGGVDENGETVGSAAAPPYAMACMPIVATTRVLARDIRVVGGVDNQTYYQPYDSQKRNPLQANRLPVADPLANLVVPSAVSDATNVNTTVRSPSHCVRVALSVAQANTLTSGVLNSLSPLLKPLFSPLIPQLTTLLTQPTLQPGVYDSITVLSPLSGATFSPGIYIIRSKSPITNMSLCILGPVEAKGVLFYITDQANFDASTGLPDAGDDSNAAPSNPVTSLAPSTMILSLLSGAHITGLNAPGSPFNGMLIYQRRLDRRPIIVEAQKLVGSGDISGTIYGKWAHTVFIGGAGSYNLRFVTGTMRVLTITDTTIAPTTLFPPAKDVLLLE
jgi:Flp pilus assembly protein TadG